MATEKKISELTALAGASVDTAADLIPIVDTSATTTKSITPDALGVTPGIKEYVALLTRTGTDAPTATIIKNTLSGTPVWSYTSTGIYTLTLASEFTSQKTIVRPVGNTSFRVVVYDPGAAAQRQMAAWRNNANSIRIQILDMSNNAVDMDLSAFQFEVAVYP